MSRTLVLLCLFTAPVWADPPVKMITAEPRIPVATQTLHAQAPVTQLQLAAQRLAHANEAAKNWLLQNWPPHIDATTTPLQREVITRISLARTLQRRQWLIRTYLPKLAAEFAARAEHLAPSEPAR
jgi:hypothetical protein